jgi:MYXO-CTERM domain-containing protein
LGSISRIAGITGLVSFGLLCACDAPELELSEFPIIGGSPDVSSTSVVFTQHSAGNCTGTLVGTQVVLSAGHCVVDDLAQGNHRGLVRFGPGGAEGFFASVPIRRLAAHRRYNGNFRVFDIALIRLAEDAPAGVPPMAFTIDPLPDSTVGAEVRTVGYGNTNGQEGTGSGERRSVFLTVTGMYSRHLVVGDSERNTCQGDSGGPSFLSGSDRVVGVTSFGAVGCAGESQLSRTDAYANDFLIEVFDAWEGPCKHDGQCVTEGCRTPDPDCDPNNCGLDEVCGTGCSTVDRDCPVGGSDGQYCTTDDDCESRHCVDALDDPRARYCSSSCDPALPGADQCAAPLSVCEAAGEDLGSCYYQGATPGTQGTTCIKKEECRSGICDLDAGICVEECGEGLPECTQGYTCQALGSTRVCGLADEGGCGCQVGATEALGSRGELLLFLLGVTGFLRIRMRRRRG